MVRWWERMRWLLAMGFAILLALGWQRRPRQNEVRGWREAEPTSAWLNDERPEHTAATPVRGGAEREAAGASPFSARRAEAPRLPPGQALIRRAVVHLLVSDLDRAVEEATGIGSALGGSTVRTRVQHRNERSFAEIVLLVPSQHLDQALEQLRRLPSVRRVESESIESEDASDELEDLAARLRSARATEERYLALLQRADKVQDILRIEEELRRIRYEIERLEGRQRQLHQRVAMALIEVVIRLADASLGRRWWGAWCEGWRTGLEALVGVSRTSGQILGWLLAFSPIVLAVAGIVRTIVRILRPRALRMEGFRRGEAAEFTGERSVA